MTRERLEEPTETDAAKVVSRVSGKGVESIRRFPTGLTHWVYDVRMALTLRGMPAGLRRCPASSPASQTRLHGCARPARAERHTARASLRI